MASRWQNLDKAKLVPVLGVLSPYWRTLYKREHCVKCPFVCVSDNKSSTVDNEEVYFLENFREQRGSLPGIYSLGLDVARYLVVGYFLQDEAETLETLIQFCEHLLRLFDFVAVERI